MLKDFPQGVLYPFFGKAGLSRRPQSSVRGYPESRRKRDNDGSARISRPVQDAGAADTYFNYAEGEPSGDA